MNPYFLDFGLSLFAHKHLENEKAGIGPRGSPSYMAPEMLVSNQYDPSLIDLWSLGVILYECLHGKLPLPQKTVPGIVEAIKKSTLIMVILIFFLFQFLLLKYICYYLNVVQFKKQTKFREFIIDYLVS